MITVQNLSHAHKGGRFALNIESAKLDSQGITAIVGSNGSGKSTLLSFLAGIAKPQKGAVRYGTKECFLGFEAIKGDVHLLSWDLQLFDGATGLDHLELLKGSVKQWDTALEETLKTEFMLPLEQPVERMSRGENVKLKILLSLCRKPKVVLIDEITNDLDSDSRQAIFKRLDEYTYNNSSLVIVATNILTDVERFATEIILLQKGKVRLKESLDGLKERHRKLTLQKSGNSLSGDPKVLNHRQLRWDGSSGVLITDCYTPAFEPALKEMGIDATPALFSLEEILSLYGDI